jgi:hypothetical protein
MGLYGLGVLMVPGKLETILPQTEALQSLHLLEETTGNLLLVAKYTQQQLKPMVVFGLGDLLILDDLGLMDTEIEVLQSPHLPEETLGNLFLLDIITRQQLKPMELCGFGVGGERGNSGTIVAVTFYNQSLHLPEEPIGNQFLVDFVTQQQSKLMVVYGVGDRILIIEYLELMMPQTEELQLPHLREERIGNRFLLDGLIIQQLKPMELYGVGVGLILDNLELIIPQL